MKLFRFCIAAAACVIAAATQAAEPLKDPHKKFIRVSPTHNLAAAIGRAQPGVTVLLADGLYRIAVPLVLRKPDVWIRSESGDRDNVILDGRLPDKPLTPLTRENCVNEIIAIRASFVTIADLTIRYARDHGIHLFPQNKGRIENALMHNIRVYDCGQQLIKANSFGTPPQWVDRVVLEDSLIEFVDNSIMQQTGESFYTGGLDVHGGKDWHIRRNVFRNIQREGKMMEHAVHMWSGSRDTIIEQNTFIDCFRAVGLGMKTKAWGKVRLYHQPGTVDPYHDHVLGIVSNNVVFNRKGIHLESGIELMNVSGTKVYHNTVVSHDKPFSSIEYRWPETTVQISNNIVSHTIMKRDGAEGVLTTNIQNAPSDLFVNYADGDLHLMKNATIAIDRGTPGKTAARADSPEQKLPRLTLFDIDGEKRDDTPDIGADEVMK
ncbi:right-handed parallel beta-helix repeat-containing protein [Planctomycetota bacterium]